MASEALVTQIAIQITGILLTSAVTLAAVRAGLINLEKRVDKAEGKLDNLPNQYVPRTEVELGLRALRDTGEKTYTLVQSYLGGRSLHAEAEARPPLVDYPYETVAAATDVASTPTSPSA